MSENYLLARFAGFAAAISVDLPKSRGVWARFARFIVLGGKTSFSSSLLPLFLPMDVGSSLNKLL